MEISKLAFKSFLLERWEKKFTPDPDNCPIASFLKYKTHRKVNVGFLTFTLFRGNRRQMYNNLPKWATDFISKVVYQSPPTFTGEYAYNLLNQIKEK